MKVRVWAVIVVLASASLLGSVLPHTRVALLTAQEQSGTVEQQAGDDQLYRIRIAADDPSALRAALESSGFDVLGGDPSSSTIDVAASSAEWSQLLRSGYAIVSVEASRPFADTRRKAKARQGSDSLVSVEAELTTGYSDLNALLARMNAIANAHPDIAQVVDLTATYQTPATAEGRHLYALRISDNVSLDEDEPSMLVVAAHHAREISTPEIGLYAASQLTDLYGVDPRITAAVDSHEIWIAPLWNPDGYNYVFTANNMWRKNRRPFASGTGVDQNRNYSQGWSTSCAGSTSVSSETYKGPSAASEAETRTMTTWSLAERFAKVLDYHSSGREVLYAYRCLNHPFTAWMRNEATTLSIVSGYGGLTREPSAEGEHPQWQFANLGSYAFLIETQTEFQPPYAGALAEAALVWPGILTTLEKPIPVRGHVTDATTGAPLAARVEITNVTFPNGETNSSGGAFGTYHLFVPPGTYTVRFSRDGYAPALRTVVVDAASAALVDVALAPSTTVYADDFEANTGWVRNPLGTDTATAGTWERGDPQATSSDGVKQLGTTVSGLNDLVTGRLSGSSSGVYDLDGGRTSMQSPAIALPADGTLTLTFNYYFAHGTNSSSADYLRVSIVSDTTTTVFEELGSTTDDDAVWGVSTINLSAFAGRTIRILVEAADNAGASLVEAGIDDVKIVRQ
jgi:murein tripeptide amidase MpaA